MKNLAALALLLMAFLSASCTDAPNKYITALFSTHAITVTSLDGKVGCSATAVGPHTLLTAAHCLQPVQLLDVDGKPYEVVESATDSYDHALVFVQGDAFTAITKIATAHPRYGDDLFYVGNPDDLSYVLRKGYLAGVKPETLGAAQLLGFLVDVNLYFGDSGSAILNKDGEIVSVVSRVVGDSGNGVSYKFAEYFALHFTPEQLARAVKF